MSFNEIVVVGNLGRDPELRYTPQGTAVCSFSMATNEKDTVRGEQVDVTTWFDVTLFGKQAEVAARFLEKGKQVYIRGSFRSEQWTDREGKPRVTNKVKAEKMKLIDRVTGERTTAAAAGAGQANAGSAESLADDEIDF
jgi:single-strand DNA-binding protein